MFITAIFTIAERWKQSKYPSSNAEMNKLWEIYIMEYHSARISNNHPAKTQYLEKEVIRAKGKN